jgi:SAM-dependent methyltransferase
VSHPERIVPDDTEPGIVALHEKRYTFALPWCRGRDVLDVACGVGYGSALLADVAARVVGGDVDEASIAYARGRYDVPNVEFRVLDAMALPFPDASFDTVCSFETIEHLPDRERYLREVGRVLRPNGTYLVSTPRVDRTNDAPANPHHAVEYSRADLERLLREHFAAVELYGQRRLETRLHAILRRLDVFGIRRRSALVRRASVLTGTPAIEHATLDDVVIAPDRLDEADEIYAVCSKPRR